MADLKDSSRGKSKKEKATEEDETIYHGVQIFRDGEVKSARRDVLVELLKEEPASAKAVGKLPRWKTAAEYPIQEEAKEPLKINLSVWIREFLVEFFNPFSMLFVALTRGRVGMVLRGMTLSKDTEEETNETNMTARTILNFALIIVFFKYSVILSGLLLHFQVPYDKGRYDILNDPDWVNRNREGSGLRDALEEVRGDGLYNRMLHIDYCQAIYVMICGPVLISLKKAVRSKMAWQRMNAFSERLDEQLYTLYLISGVCFILFGSSSSQNKKIHFAALQQ